MRTPPGYPPARGPLDVGKLVDQLIAREAKALLDPLTRKANQLNAALATCEALLAALRGYRKVLHALARTASQSRHHPPRVQRRRAHAHLHVFNGLIRHLAGLARPGAMPRHPLAGDPLTALLISELRGARRAGSRGAPGFPEPVGAVWRMHHAAAATGIPRQPGIIGCTRRLDDLARQIGSRERILALLDLALSANGLLPRQIGELQESLDAVARAYADQHAGLCRLRQSYTLQFERLNHRLARLAPPAYQPSWRPKNGH